MKCQTAFVEDPTDAVDAADHLVSDVLDARGCSVANVEDRAAKMSASYPKRLVVFDRLLSL